MDTSKKATDLTEVAKTLTTSGKLTGGRMTPEGLEIRFLLPKATVSQEALRTTLAALMSHMM